jgi:pimeloyl-ACP methyl ester carboxylesterase
MEYKTLEKGGGKPVIMLHGLFGHAANWNGIMTGLSEQYGAIALELPYMELEKEDCSVERLSGYVLGFADSRGIDSAIYIGNSLGGHIALDIAIKRPSRVDALILTGSSGLFERSYEEDLEIHPTKPYVRKKVSEIFFDEEMVTDELVDDVYNAVNDKRTRLKALRLMKSARNYNVRGLLPRIKCPTLLIWGKDDAITPPEVAKEFKEGIKGSRLEFIDRCCHAPMMEYPERFKNIAFEFLSEHRGRAV